MKFSKEILQEMAGWGCGAKNGEFEVVENEIIDHSRWTVSYNLVFKHTDSTGLERFYSSCYDVGATECQDESPYDNEDDEVECAEVRPVEKTVIVYE